METSEVKTNTYNEVEGDLIELAKEGKFDVIAHGCNCQNAMGAGIAPQMAKAFGADYVDDFDQEDLVSHGGQSDPIEKLGTISWWNPSVDFKTIDEGMHERFKNLPAHLIVVNAYTQEFPGYNSKGIDHPPVDYEAVTLCFRKMNTVFKGKHIGLPQIGAGLAGGDWERIKKAIQDEFTDCDVTVVIYKPTFSISKSLH